MNSPQLRKVSLLFIICIYQLVFADANLGQSADGLTNRDQPNVRPNSKRKNRSLKIIENVPYADTDNPRQQIDPATTIFFESAPYFSAFARSQRMAALQSCIWAGQMASPVSR